MLRSIVQKLRASTELAQRAVTKSDRADAADLQRIEAKLDELIREVHAQGWPTIQRRISMIEGEKTARYALEHMWPHAHPYGSRDAIWNAALESVTLDGFHLEFGVFKGTSIRYFAEHRPKWHLHGFDSFEGLPEKWSPKHEKGHFAVPKLPKVPRNVTLHKGFFDSSLPEFVRSYMKPSDAVAFLHIDSDLYSSAKTIFENLGRFFRPGTVILFDEYFGYKGWERDVVKAFREYRESTGLKYEYLGFQDNWTRVLARVTDPGTPA